MILSKYWKLCKCVSGGTQSTMMGLDKHGYIFIVAIVPENTTKHMLLQTSITV